MNKTAFLRNWGIPLLVLAVSLSFGVLVLVNYNKGADVNGDFEFVNTAAGECDQTVSNPASFNWNSLNPGDVVCLANGTLDGGISISASGTANNPIVIRGSGSTTLNGGRTADLPECGSSQFGRNDSDHEAGIDLNGSSSHIIFDNFDIEGFWRNGINVDSPQVSNITFKNMRIENNGTGWNGPGVQYAGSNMVFEDMIILNNAQDAFQTDHYAFQSDVSLTVRNSVIGNTRQLSSDSAKSFNDCTHADGLQIHTGDRFDITFESVDIIGVTNGFMIGGDNREDLPRGRIDVEMKLDDVFVFAYENGFRCKPNDTTTCKNFDINNMILYTPNQVKNHDILRLDGNGHTIKNSAFIGTPGRASFNSSASITRVCSQNIKNDVGTNTNPQIADLPSGVGDLDFDARITSSVCKDDSAPTPNVTAQPTDSPNTIPTGTDSVLIELENGGDDFIISDSSTSVVYDFNLQETGVYTLRMNLNAPNGGANSLYVNINSNPNEDDYFVWDITEAQTELDGGRINSVNDYYLDDLTWRGDDGNFDAPDPDFNPVEFDLAAGNHTLYLNGREDGLIIDYIEIVQISSNNNSSDGGDGGTDGDSGTTDDSGSSDGSSSSSSGSSTSSSSSSSGSSTGSSGSTSTTGGDVNPALNTEIEECKNNYFNGQTYVTPLNDIANSTFEDFIIDLHCRRVISGYSTGDYRSDGPVTRYAMAKFIVEAFDIEIDSSNSFLDVPSSNVFSDYAHTLKATGISQGDRSGNFNGSEEVTRGQVIAFIVRALEYKDVSVFVPDGSTSFTDLETDDTFYGEVRFIEEYRTPDGNRILNGYPDGTVGLDRNITRGEMSKVISNASSD